MLTIACCLWQDEKTRWGKAYTYSKDHVNNLFLGACEHISTPFRFICLCDRDYPFLPGIEKRFLDQSFILPGTRFPKLLFFHPFGREIFGERIFYIDLDSLIIGNLDPLVSREEDFLCWLNPSRFNPINSQRRTLLNSSVFSLAGGSKPQVWDEFDWIRTPKELKMQGMRGTDQVWISQCPPDAVGLTKEDGVYSFRVDLLEKNLPCPPADAKIISFHGMIDPSMRALQEKYSWIKDHWRY